MRTLQLINRSVGLLGALVLLAAIAVPVSAGTGSGREAKAPRSAGSKSALSRRKLSPSRAAAVKAAEELKSSLVALQTLHEAEAGRLAGRIGELEKLFSEGIISRKELEDAKSAVAASKGKVDDVGRQIVETDQTIAELMAPDPVIVASTRRGSRTISMRSLGIGSWSLSNAGAVDQFFRSRFGRPLPVSAFGQSSVHSRLGYDHSNAFDVPVHPDSAEGQTLIAYLRTQGIPFLAFRGAVPGVSTGAHIHVGRPSHRF
jgi:hypothetical protein